MSDDNKATPATPSMAYAGMVSAWDKIGTVLKGTEAMRKAGAKYLPEYQNEGDKSYEARRKGAVLHNVTSLTLNSWVGRPFSDPLQIPEEMPEDVTGYLRDIDLQGSDVAVFARNWFKEGLAKAFAHVLIEMPRPIKFDEEGNEIPRTKADDLAENIRPYWSFIPPENLIYASSVVVDSVEVLTQVRILETEIEQDDTGWGEKEVRRIRVYRKHLDIEGAPVTFEVWTWDPEEDEWMNSSPPQQMDIENIPLVTFYADRTGLLEGKSPLEDLVDLNISHWQSKSDQTNVLTVARFPILAASGITKEESSVLVGPRQLLWSSNPDAKFYYVEHEGASIAAGRQDLLDLEEAMAEYGADFLRKRPGDVTATSRALDSAEATSPLQDAVIRFNDALEQAMAITAEWLGVEELPEITVPIDFGPEEIVQGDLDSLKEARRMRDLSRESYLDELARRGVLADTFDQAINDQQLESEDSMAFGGAPTDGKPINEEEADEDDEKKPEDDDEDETSEE
jgi:hypothetical protein